MTASPSPWIASPHGEDAALEAAFTGRATIGAPLAARLLGMDIKTLQRHVAAGHLVGRLKGFGCKRRHLVFTRGDVTRFLHSIIGSAANEFEIDFWSALAIDPLRLSLALFDASGDDERADQIILSHRELRPAD